MDLPRSHAHECARSSRSRARARAAPVHAGAPRAPGAGNVRAAAVVAGQVDNSKLDEAQLARICAACPHLESLAVAGAGAAGALVEGCD